MDFLYSCADHRTCFMIFIFSFPKYVYLSSGINHFVDIFIWDGTINRFVRKYSQGFRLKITKERRNKKHIDDLEKKFFRSSYVSSPPLKRCNHFAFITMHFSFSFFSQQKQKLTEISGQTMMIIGNHSVCKRKHLITLPIARYNNHPDDFNRINFLG